MRGVGYARFHVSGGPLSGLFSGFGRENEREKQGNKCLFFPCPLRVQEKKKTYDAIQKLLMNFELQTDEIFSSVKL
jgi:hypothetical protein